MTKHDTKPTEYIVREIRAAQRSGYRAGELCKEYGISYDAFRRKARQMGLTGKQRYNSKEE